MQGRRNPFFSWRMVALAACGVATIGCVRQGVSGDVVIYHYRWWTALCAMAPLALAGMILARYPSTWIAGAWRPWWQLWTWHYLDGIRFVGFIFIAAMSPLMICDQLQIGRDYVQESNWLGVGGTRRLAFRDLQRIDLKSDKPAGGWTPDTDREHKKKPDMVLVRKDGGAEEFRGWLVSEARPTLLERARAAGVQVATTDDPGVVAAPAFAPGPPMPGARPFGVPAGPPWGANR